MRLEAQPASAKLTVTITRAATGAVETHELALIPTPAPKED